MIDNDMQMIPLDPEMMILIPSVKQSKVGEVLENGGISFPGELQNTNTKQNDTKTHVCTHIEKMPT